MVLQFMASELTFPSVATPAAPAGTNWSRLRLPGKPSGRFGFVPSLPVATVGSIPVNPENHVPGLHGTVQLPAAATGPPVSLPLWNSMVLDTTRPVAGEHACAAVALSETPSPRLRKLSMMVLAMRPPVPRRRLEPCSVFSPTVFVCPAVPTRVTLQTFGALRGRRSNPFSLSSHSKPLLPAFCMIGL